MKISDFKELFEYIKLAGIHDDPYSLTKQELENLAKNPEARKKILSVSHQKNLNFYQELEMNSPYVNTHRDISYEPECVQLHSHSFYEIIFCESGDIQYLIADKRYRIHAGDVILVPPGISHRPLFYEKMKEPYSRIILWICTDFLRTITTHCPKELLQKIRSQEHFLLRTEGTPYKYIESFFKRGVQEVNETAPLWEMSLYANTTMLLVHLCRAMLFTDSVFPTEKREDLDRIITYIEKHYSDKITLEDTARSFHISTSTLGKLFYKKLGISFYHFVTQRRLINSKLKIEEGSSMEEAALTCGFCDYSAFYRAFKKEYGITPREYKKLVARNIEL